MIQKYPNMSFEKQKLTDGLTNEQNEAQREEPTVALAKKACLGIKNVEQKGAEQVVFVCSTIETNQGTPSLSVQTMLTP